MDINIPGIDVDILLKSRKKIAILQMYTGKFL